MPWHNVEPASKIRVGEVLPFTIAGKRLAVGRTERGYFAMDDWCPHAGGSLAEGMISDDCLICPIHGYAYDTLTGEGIDDGDDVQVYPVELDGDVLRIQIEESEETPS